MSDGPVTIAEMAQALELARAAFTTFEARISTIIDGASPRDHQFELARGMLTAKRVIGAALLFFRPPRTSKKPPRGLGYSKEEALIVASLPWFADNLSEAIRAHYPAADPDLVQVHARRIRRRRRDIELVSGERPWESSHNWLGDLIEQ